jgi:nucleolar complex protein 3
MIKEKHYSIHPNTLRCLYHLRLKRELNVRASQSRVDKASESDEPKKKIRKKDRQHLSKKMRKALKESKAIQHEMKEAEAQVDTEERASRVSLSELCTDPNPKAWCPNVSN